MKDETPIKYRFKENTVPSIVKLNPDVFKSSAVKRAQDEHISCRVMNIAKRRGYGQEQSY